METNNDLQNTTQKAKDQGTRTPPTPGMNSGAPKGLAVFAPHVTPVVLLLLRYEGGREWTVITTSGRYLWSFVTQIFRNG